MNEKIFNYKGVKVNAFGIPIFSKEKSRIKKKTGKEIFIVELFHLHLKLIPRKI